ncbi:MAG: methyltransferase domain-containing protein [Actinomycetota bacterium]|nr:methyltransferase domain-containing protein [Actinomycetota bacterium]
MAEHYQAYLRRWFDRLAPHYDRLEIVLSGVRPVVVELASPRNGSRILDAATGTGRQAFAFASKGHEVVGIDISHRMVEVARGNNAYHNARFAVEDASAMPFPDGSFDICCISFALHDMPRPMREAVLGEMSRVTTPGGAIVIADYELPGGPLHRFFVRFVTPFYENKYVPDYFSYDLEGRLRDMGMEIVEKRPVLMGWGKVIKALNH